MKASSRRRKGRKRGKRRDTEKSVIVRGPKTIFPESYESVLHYYTPITMSNAAASYVSVRYRPNNVFDVDPLVGSTAVPGFAELALIYGTYRLLGYEAVVDFVNAEAFAVQAFIYPWSNLQTAPSANDATTPELIVNQRAKSHVLSAQGGQDRIRLSQKVNLSTLYSNQVLTDDAFAAKVTTGPAFVIYHVVGAICPGAKVLTVAGISTFIHYYLRVKFYGRIPLIS